MDDICDLEERLRQSLRTLRAWRWMAQLSDNVDEVITLLNAEARDLINLGRNYPERAREIGRLIVAYHRMITGLKEAAGPAALQQDNNFMELPVDEPGGGGDWIRTSVA